MTVQSAGPMTLRRLLPLGMLLVALACSKDEQIAQKYFEKGKSFERNHQYPQAMQLYREIEKKFPETKAAKQVKESVDYTFIEQAMSIERRKNVNDVGESMKVIAKAVENYNFKNSQYPLSLDALVPEYLPAIPRDPWGARYSYGRVDEANNIVDDPAVPATNYILAWFGRDRVPGGDGDDADLFIRTGQPVAF